MKKILLTLAALLLVPLAALHPYRRAESLVKRQ